MKENTKINNHEYQYTCNFKKPVVYKYGIRIQIKHNEHEQINFIIQLGDLPEHDSFRQVSQQLEGWSHLAVTHSDATTLGLFFIPYPKSTFSPRT